jgi:hypothetical protein
VEPVADLKPRAAGLEIARAHRFVGDEQIMQPPGAGQAEFVAGVEQRQAFVAEQPARMVQRDGLEEGFGVSPAQRLKVFCSLPGATPRSDAICSSDGCAR